MAMSDAMTRLVEEIDAGVRSIVEGILSNRRYRSDEVLLPLFEDVSTFPSMSGKELKRLLLLRVLVLWYNLLPSLRASNPPATDLARIWAEMADDFHRALSSRKLWLQRLMGGVLSQHPAQYPNAQVLMSSLRRTLANRGTSHREGYLLEAVEIMIGLR